MRSQNSMGYTISSKSAWAVRQDRKRGRKGDGIEKEKKPSHAD